TQEGELKRGPGFSLTPSAGSLNYGPGPFPGDPGMLPTRSGRTALRPALPVLLALASLASGPGRCAAADTLPQAPDGTQVRAVASFAAADQEPVRIAAHPATGRLYVLGGGGDVFLLDPAAETKRRVLTGADYIEQPKRQQLNIPLPVDAQWVNAPIALRATLCLGLTFDREGRLYVVANVQI